MRDKYNEALRGYVVGTHLIEPWTLHFKRKRKGCLSYCAFIFGPELRLRERAILCWKNVQLPKDLTDCIEGSERYTLLSDTMTATKPVELILSDG